MSKVSSANYPKYSSSLISLADSKAKTGVVDGVLESTYDMSDSESAIYNYALNTIASILPQINTFDTNTLSSMQSQVDAYKSAGIEDINQLYNSSLTDLQNNVASRFGNLDNSIFMDNLSSIESERADAVSSFAQDILAKQSQLKSDELTKRYALIELLGGLADTTYNNALKTISTALGGSSNYNNYNSDLYSALSDMSSTNSSNSNTNDLLLSLIQNGSLKDLASLATLTL